jgi:hypothetical protein
VPGYDRDGKAIPTTIQLHSLVLNATNIIGGNRGTDSCGYGNIIGHVISPSV